MNHTNKFIRKHSGLYFNFGLSYDLKADLNGTSDQYLNRDNISGFSNFERHPSYWAEYINSVTFYI